MSYSAQTEKLRLPQWVTGSKDHPDFLTDVNQAFEKIDGFAQGIDNTVDGLPEQVEEVATILQSVQEDVGEHTEELARQGVMIGILETGMAEVNGLDSRVAALEDGQRAQDEAINGIVDANRSFYAWHDIVLPGISYPIELSNNSGTETIRIQKISTKGSFIFFQIDEIVLPDSLLYAHFSLDNATSSAIITAVDTIVSLSPISGFLNGTDSNGRAFQCGEARIGLDSRRNVNITLMRFPGMSQYLGENKKMHAQAVGIR